jgi:uncharacterized membrane protein YgdD (TMEM256/DUF423 family)
MERKIAGTAAILGGIAILLGAFGAHALKKHLNLAELNTFETGVRYQMYHALFLLYTSQTKAIIEKTKNIIYNLVLLGTLLFSGSIYLLATNNLTLFNFKPIGFITPIGGFLLILAWFVLFFNLLKKKV